jgi:hypothetical protein
LEEEASFDTPISVSPDDNLDVCSILFALKSRTTLLSGSSPQPRQEMIVHHINGTPHRQRNARSTVAVIVNDELAVYDLAVEAKRCATGTQTDPNIFLYSSDRLYTIRKGTLSQHVKEHLQSERGRAQGRPILFG